MADKVVPSFNLDKVLKAESDAEPFAFILGGKVRYLKHQRTIPLVDTDNLTDRSGVTKLLRVLAADEETFDELIDAHMTLGQANDLINAWREYCGITSGE